MVAIQWPTNTAPGLTDQDGAGRLINCFSEPRENNTGTVWRRVPGAVTFTNTYPTTLAITSVSSVAFVGTNATP